MIHSPKDSKEFNKKSFEYKNKFKHKVLQSSDTYEITKEQGYNEWRLARQFRITSTVGEKLIELFIKYNPKEIENNNREHGLLSQSLGFSIKTPTEELSDELLSYSRMTEEELNQLTLQVLKPIVSEYGHKVSGKKAELVSRILEGPKNKNHDGNILEEIVKCWFLKPIRSEAMKFFNE